jgi:phosphatidylglycerophosphate synthase
MPDIEKSEKLPPEHRYFNISIIWIFYFRRVIRLLYQLGIPHEAVTLLSILSGILSAYLFYHGSFIAAAVTLHFKDVFDACDGALARLTGRGHLIGRYVDSLGDFVSLTLVMLAIGWRAYQAGSPIYLFWMGFAIVSTFIQCSFFNYYQLAYLEEFGIERLSSKKDEIHRRDQYLISRTGKPLLRILRFFYLIIYGWQDWFVARVDKWLYARSGCASTQTWYGNKTFMTLQSPLCFGTQIFVIIVFAIPGRPEYSLVAIAVGLNILLTLVLLLRRYYFAVRVITRQAA